MSEPHERRMRTARVHGQDRVHAAEQLWKVSLVMLLTLWPSEAHAHPFAPGTLSLSETARPDVYGLRWAAPRDASALPQRVTVGYGPGCSESSGRLLCTPGTRPQITVAGLRETAAEVLVRVEHRDGRVETRLMRGSAPRFSPWQRDGAASWGATLERYTRLGIEHIMEGFDHLLLVFALVLLVGLGPSLVWTLSAFTLAHSVTLMLSSMNMIALPTAPVEISIALSLVLVGRELVVDQDSLTRRRPALVALLLGLVHGGGFAGALRALGLPEAQMGAALLGFNLGVELGQLLLVLACFVLWHLWTSTAGKPASSTAARLRSAGGYLTGCIALFWTMERVRDAWFQ